MSSPREGLAHLDDTKLVEGLAGATLDAGAFHHADHVRAAWLYLQRYEPAEALRRYSADLRHLATAHGAPERYHETITWGYLLLIRERFEPGESWPDFRGRNPDLLDRERPALARYYTPALLASDRARRRFVFPDRGPDAPTVQGP